MINLRILPVQEPNINMETRILYISLLIINTILILKLCVKVVHFV